MNSVFNEHPSRKISDDFIEKAVAEARASFKVIKLEGETAAHGRPSLSWALPVIAVFVLMANVSCFRAIPPRRITRTQGSARFVSC